MQLQRAARQFVQEEIVPVGAHYDRTMEFPWEVVRKAHANGFMNLSIPTEYGQSVFGWYIKYIISFGQIAEFGPKLFWILRSQIFLFFFKERSVISTLFQVARHWIF